MRLPLLLAILATPVLTTTSAAEATWTQVKAVLDARCISCHGESKQKGGLRLDSVAAVQQGGKDGLVVVPGKPEQSKLYTLAALPADDDDRMPPKGARLTAEQLATLKDWITAGASYAGAPAKPEPAKPEAAKPEAAKPEPAKPAMQEVPPSPMMAMEDTAEAAHGASAKTRPATPAAQVPPAPALPAGVLDELAAQQILATVLPGGWLDVNAAHTKGAISDPQLSLLAKAAPAVAYLDLAGSGITDRQVATLVAAGFPSLGRLHLENTAVGDPALTALAKLPTLTYLNLRNTQVGDGGLAALGKVATLEQLYLWQSKVTPAGAAKLRQALPELTVVLGPDDLPTGKMPEKRKGKKK